MKRLKALALVATMLLGSIVLTGCNNDSNASNEDKLKIGLILGEGGVNDLSFNQSAWEGALKAQEKHGNDVEVFYIESHQESDYMTNIESAIDQEADLIIGVGFKLTDAIKEAAMAYPEQKFAMLDGTYDEIPENITSILFNEKQAGYAVGLIASKMTKTNTVGFIGGFDVPTVTNFLVGFEEAIKETNPKATILTQYANSFTDAAKGKAIASQMISNNADIIFTAGGGVNAGAWEAVKESNVYAIGVDMPSNYILPETIITSALKNVGTGVELTIESLLNGEFNGGSVSMFDLSNQGVGFEKTGLLSEDVINYVEDKISSK